jgi:hypothetical protein
MGREPKLLVGIGKKGAGKSYTTEKMIQQYAKGNPAKGVPPRRVLILDVNDEYYHVKALRIQDIAVFSVHPMIEVRRIRPFMDDGTKMSLDDIAQTLFNILTNFRNGLLLIEDINKYISDSMPNDLVGSICTNRHIGVDIVLHYQSIGRITSKVWQNVNILRIHKFTDTVAKHKHKFEDKYEYLSLGEIIVNTRNEQGDKYFYLFADVDEEKIYGAFSDEEYESAVNKFIQNHYAKIVNPLLKARDERGKKLHNPQSAIAEVKNRLMHYHKKIGT